MTDFKMQLASELVTEQKTVTYRNLARSQKVHVNSAKCMLYEFYESQKKRKPGSVYATYLLAGIKKREHRETVKVDEDVSMRSSPPPTSSMPQSQPQNEDIEVKTITLVREEDLDGTLIHTERCNCWLMNMQISRAHTRRFPQYISTVCLQ